MRTLMVNYPYKKLQHWTIDFVKSLHLASQHDRYFYELFNEVYVCCYNFSLDIKGIWKLPFVLGTIAFDSKLKFYPDEWRNFIISEYGLNDKQMKAKFDEYVSRSVDGEHVLLHYYSFGKYDGLTSTDPPLPQK